MGWWRSVGKDGQVDRASDLTSAALYPPRPEAQARAEQAMTLGRFWLAIPLPRIPRPKCGVLHGTFYFWWGKFGFGMWSREAWAKGRTK